MKLIYLVLNHAAADWKQAPREWNEARVQFALAGSPLANASWASKCQPAPRTRVLTVPAQP